MEEEFIAATTSRGKEPIKIEEGSSDSDDPVREVVEPVVTTSRRRVSKRSSNTGSRLQECLDMLKCSLKRREKEKNCTPPDSKISKSVMNPEKLTKNNIEEAMAVLNDMCGSLSIEEYITTSHRLSNEEHTCRMFMCFVDDARLPWARSLLGP
ncbi:hypothetical protein CRG98_034810 [Punica granatum]|uniref:Uncharacterized protein n=1 Tax=Punica granatum TaxID=22663 RepID=A0A2I0ILI8_PUNGR|nr:hypothetical protein CRG98_034810 [Punica granatum]